MRVLEPVRPKELVGRRHGVEPALVELGGGQRVRFVDAPETDRASTFTSDDRVSETWTVEPSLTTFGQRVVRAIGIDELLGDARDDDLVFEGTRHGDPDAYARGVVACRGWSCDARRSAAFR